jgi:hypothetical protein
MTNWTPPDRSGSRAVLIGTSRYAELTEVPAAANSLDSMYRLLTGPLCAWPDSQVTLIAEPESPGDLPDLLVEEFGQAQDVALFYYVGHGQVDFEDELCLGLTGSRIQSERRATTSLTFAAVRRALRASPSAMKIVILDCCFAGHAVHSHNSLAGVGDMDITGMVGASGAYTLAATGPTSTAWFESSAGSPLPHTHFTRALVDTVARGIPDGPTSITLEPLYRRVREVLQASGKPVPTRSSRDLAADFVFARNAAPQPAAEAPERSSTARFDRRRARRRSLLDDAEDAARAVPDTQHQCKVLIAIAEEAATDDRDRARRLLEETERITIQVQNHMYQVELWWDLASAAVGTDAARARRFLEAFEQAIMSPNTSERDRDVTLGLNCRLPALLRLDPDRTGRLAAAITDPTLRRYFVEVATEAVAGRDPGLAERLARLAPPESGQGTVLTHLIKAVLDDDPDRAERVARGIADALNRCGGLAAVAATVAPHDLDRARDLLGEAERTAQQAGEAGEVSACQTEIIYELTRDYRIERARNSPAAISWLREQAQRILGQISSAVEAAQAATAAAKAMLPEKPVEAKALVWLAEQKVRSIADNWERHNASSILHGAATAMLGMDAKEAARIAWQMPTDGIRDIVFTAIVAAVAVSDPGEAERLAHHIADPGRRGPALALVAMAIAGSDPENASTLLDHARRVARAAGRDAPEAVARQVATHDPDLAITVLSEDSGASDLSRGLAGISDVVAGKNLEHAEKIARTIPDSEGRSRALVTLAARWRKTPG